MLLRRCAVTLTVNFLGQGFRLLYDKQTDKQTPWKIYTTPLRGWWKKETFKANTCHKHYGLHCKFVISTMIKGALPPVYVLLHCKILRQNPVNVFYIKTCELWKGFAQSCCLLIKHIDIVSLMQKNSQLHAHNLTAAKGNLKSHLPEKWRNADTGFCLGASAWSPQFCYIIGSA